MKKLLGILAAAALVFGVASCANDEGVMTVDSAVKAAKATGDYLSVAVNTVIKVAGKVTDSVTLKVSETAAITTNSSKEFTYESDDEAIVTVSDEGLVTGVAAGTANITVKSTVDGEELTFVKRITVADTVTYDFANLTDTDKTLLGWDGNEGTTTSYGATVTVLEDEVTFTKLSGQKMKVAGALALVQLLELTLTTILPVLGLLMMLQSALLRLQKLLNQVKMVQLHKL